MTTEAVATVTKPEPLTVVERRKFNDLDGIVEKGLQTFAEVGGALSIIRDQRLYREDFGTFEAYCQARCGWTDRRARQLIDAHEVVVGLLESGTTVPVNEGQARELVAVPVDQRAEVLEEARADAEAKGKPVTAKHVRTARDRRMLPKPRKPKAEPKTMAEEVAEATARRLAEASEPTPVENAEPVVVEGETEPAEGKVVVFIRSIDMPDEGDVDGMTDADLHTVRLLQGWCGRVIAHYAKHNALAA